MTSSPHAGGSTAAKERRATVYFEPDLHTALRLKAAETERSMSELVNDAVRILLAEDAADLEATRERVQEPTVSYERFVQDLKDRGKL
ncbi:hypothetical protein BH23BAC4_BH23BAC4_03900 [soil metagenome]